MLMCNAGPLSTKEVGGVWKYVHKCHNNISCLITLIWKVTPISTRVQWSHQLKSYLANFISCSLLLIIYWLSLWSNKFAWAYSNYWTLSSDASCVCLPHLSNQPIYGIYMSKLVSIIEYITWYTPTQALKQIHNAYPPYSLLRLTEQVDKTW